MVTVLHKSSLSVITNSKGGVESSAGGGGGGKDRGGRVIK